MGTLLIAFKAVTPLFLAIFAGIVFSRTKKASENWVDVLNNYALRIGLPALVIASEAFGTGQKGTVESSSI